MPIVMPRVGRIAITNAANSVRIATFDYAMPAQASRAVEAAVYEEVISFVWGSIPALLSDASVFGFHLEEAVSVEGEYIPLYSREPLAPLQLVQTILRMRNRVTRHTCRAVTPVLPPMERVVRTFLAGAWRAGAR